jgi:hypothetical protein
VFFRVGHAERHFTMLVHAMPPFATGVAVQRGLKYFFRELARAARNNESCYLPGRKKGGPQGSP